MRQRDFLALTAAMTWPLAARAQDPVRVIGILASAPYTAILRSEDSFAEGLEESGFIEGKNIKFEWRRAHGEYDRLRALATDLVNRHVAVLVALDAPAASAAKTATKDIPVVFATGADPVKLGLVDSISRPGGNLTGVWVLVSLMGPKRLELLHELLPSASTIVLLVNPMNPNVRADVPETEAAAKAFGLQLNVMKASTEEEMEADFVSMTNQGASAFMVMPDPFLLAQRERVVSLASRHALAGMYPFPEFVEVGGLISYGTRVADLYRLLGRHTGKILRGANPAELPIFQAATFDLTINLKTAKALGITVAPTLLDRANEVIE